MQVQYVYLTDKGPAPAKTRTLKANSRDTIWLNVDAGNIGGVGATFTTIGGYGIVVERSIYWGGVAPNWIEGTNDVGVNAPAMAWSLPEGTDAEPFDTFVLAANPNTFPVRVRVQFYLEGGGRITVPEVTLAGQTRLTIDMSAPRGALPTMSASDAQLLAGQSFATKVTSLTPNGPIIVESAVYRNWNPTTRWRAGASAFGVPQ